MKASDYGALCCGAVGYRNRSHSHPRQSLSILRRRVMIHLILRCAFCNTHTPVILTARNSSVELALRAIGEEGAYHFRNPTDGKVSTCEGAVNRKARAENKSAPAVAIAGIQRTIGNSKKCNAICLIEQVASSSAFVLIPGDREPGRTWHEQLHNLSPAVRVLAINCS